MDFKRRYNRYVRAYRRMVRHRTNRYQGDAEGAGGILGSVEEAKELARPQESDAMMRRRR